MADQPVDERFEIRNADVERTLRSLAALLDEQLPEGFAFGLFLVPFGEHAKAAPGWGDGKGGYFWISSAERAGMVDIVEHWVQQQRLKERRG